MKQLNLYTNRCLTCDEGDRVNKVRTYAKKNNLNFVMRRVDLAPELKKLADVFAEPMPFMEVEGKTLDFFAISTNPTIIEEELEELIK